MVFVEFDTILIKESLLMLGWEKSRWTTGAFSENK